MFWDFNAIDDFYKTDMPDWPFNDGLDNPHLVEVCELTLSFVILFFFLIIIIINMIVFFLLGERI